jgi:hypothetical protein
MLSFRVVCSPKDYQYLLGIFGAVAICIESKLLPLLLIPEIFGTLDINLKNFLGGK